MTEVVVALLMMINNEIKEHRIQPDGMAQCLKRKREAERVYKEGISYSCLRSKAELEKNIDGSLSIKKLILEQ
jgi:hypothetical protein